jgi:tRNA-specific 2-thiouridylase
MVLFAYIPLAKSGTMTGTFNDTFLPTGVIDSLPRLSQDEADRLLANYDVGPRDGAGRKVVVAMSGGVDSAVTALLLRERGYDVVGVNMRVYTPEDDTEYINPCCSIESLENARDTARRMEIPFYPLNVQKEFERVVINYFVDEYAQGRTPNPCLECNRHVKFHHLIARARYLGASFLATGHYARIRKDEQGMFHLHEAVDASKDQSYVLYMLSQEQLGFLLFPLGNLLKSEVREIATAFGLPVANVPDSQGTCFVGKGAYADFVSKRRPGLTDPGDIVDLRGNVLGRHNGLLHYTVGQRRGIGVAGPEPYFVLRLDLKGNRLVIGTREEMGFSTILANQVDFVSGVVPSCTLECEVSVRYRGNRYAAGVEPLGDGRARVHFTGDMPSAAAPGQAVVFYHGDEVLGGGTIQAAEHVQSPATALAS